MLPLANPKAQISRDHVENPKISTQLRETEGKEKPLTFHKVFSEASTQEEVFEE